MRILSSLLLGRRFGQSHLNKGLFPKTLTSQYHHVERVSTHEGDLLGRYFQGKRFLSHKQHYAHFCTLIRNQTGNPNQFEVEIISKEFVKPKTSTPQHLKTYEVAIFDQLTPNVYMSFVYFYPNDHQSNNDIILEKTQALKHFLSETLTKFYPLAGRIKDSRYIDCNDDGVYYVEGKVRDHLSDFLKHPDNKSIHKLLPVDPNSEELLTRKDLVMIQVTKFGCGGISVGFYTGHKIFDFGSIVTFLKCWSSTARSSSEQISPTFISGSVYPSNPALSHDATIAHFPLYSKTNNSTRRFLFRAASLATLKQKADSSRVLAVAALIWKCAVAASKAQLKSDNGTAKNATLALSVNLRNRSSPPTPPHSIGNLVALTPPITCSKSDDLKLNSCAQSLKDATKLYSSDFIDTWRGYLSSDDVEGTVLNTLKTWYSDKDAKHMIATSICNSGKYEIDFGWGKPVWICVGNGDSNYQYTENFVILMETRCGSGIEAWVTLSEEDMAVFERDPEILSIASLNVDPLELVE